jgi:hypothetical protein
LFAFAPVSDSMLLPMTTLHSLESYNFTNTDKQLPWSLLSPLLCFRLVESVLLCMRLDDVPLPNGADGCCDNDMIVWLVDGATDK